MRIVHCLTPYYATLVQVGLDGDGTKRQYVQGYKMGIWDTRRKLFRSDAEFPIVDRKPFWWRIVLHPAGFAVSRQRESQIAHYGRILWY